jgi:hypothetical protein
MSLSPRAVAVQGFAYGTLLVAVQGLLGIQQLDDSGAGSRLLSEYRAELSYESRESPVRKRFQSAEELGLGGVSFADEVRAAVRAELAQKRSGSGAARIPPDIVRATDAAIEYVGQLLVKQTVDKSREVVAQLQQYDNRLRAAVLVALLLLDQR